MPPVSRYCSYCGQNLDGSEPASDEDIQKFVLKHPKETKEYLDQSPAIIAISLDNII
jgi:hypothetical protein